MTFHNPSSGLLYAWTSSGNCNAYLSDTTIANPQFTPPTGAYNCTYYLNVYDSCGCSGMDSVRIFCSSPLASGEINPVNTFSIHPNPAASQFTVSFNAYLLSKESKIQNVQLKIVDITGRVVLEQTILNYQSTIINSEFSPGIYFVTVSDGAQLSSQNLVIE